MGWQTYIEAWCDNCFEVSHYPSLASFKKLGWIKTKKKIFCGKKCYQEYVKKHSL